MNGEGTESDAPKALPEEYIREAVHFVVNWHAATVNMRLYPPTSPMVTDTVESARNHLEKLFERRDHFSVSILENNLLVGDVRLDESEQQKLPVKSFVQWMNERMLTHLEFKKGISPEELLQVFEVLAAASDREQRENISEKLEELGIYYVTVNQRVYVAVTAGEDYSEGVRKAGPLDALKDELLMRYLMGQVDMGEVEDRELVEVLSDPQKVGGLLSTFISVEGTEGGVLVRSQKAEEALNTLTEMVVNVKDEDLRQTLTEQIGAIISEMSPREMTSMLTGESTENLNIRHVRERVITMLSDNQLLDMVDSLIADYLEMKEESDQLETVWTKEKLKHLNELLTEMRDERGDAISGAIDEKLEEAGIEEERDPGTGGRVFSAYQLLGGLLEEEQVKLYGDLNQEVSNQVRRMYAMEEDDLAAGMLITLVDNLKQDSASVRRFASELMLETLEGLENEYQLMAAEVLEKRLTEHLKTEFDYAAYVAQVDSMAVIARRYMLEGMSERASEMVDLLREQTGREAGKGPELVKHTAGVVEMLTGPEGLIDLRALLLKDDEKERLDTVRALSKLGPNALLPLVDLVKDRGQVDLRERAIEALKSTGEVGVETLLGELGKKNPWYVHRNILNVIAELKLKQAVGPVGEMVKNPDERIRREAVRSLARIGEKQSIPLIETAASDPSAAVRRTAVRVMGMFGDGSVAPFLLDIINGRGPRGKEEENAVMEAACLALGDLHDAKYIPELTDLASKGGLFKKARPDEIRAAACIALGAIGDDSVIPVLERAMKDPSMMVRSSAEKAMRKLGGGIAAPEPLSQDDLERTGATPTSGAPAGSDTYRPPPHREAEVVQPEAAPEATPQPEAGHGTPAFRDSTGAEWPPRPEETSPGAPEAVQPYSMDVLKPPEEGHAAESIETEEETAAGEWQTYQETSFEEQPVTVEEVAGEEAVETEEPVQPAKPGKPEAPWPEAGTAPGTPAPPGAVEMPRTPDEGVRSAGEWPEVAGGEEPVQAAGGEATAAPERPLQRGVPAGAEQPERAPDTAPLAMPPDLPEELPPAPLEELLLEEVENRDEEGPPRESGRTAGEIDPAVTLEDLIMQSEPPQEETPPERKVEVPEWPEPPPHKEAPQGGDSPDGHPPAPPPHQE